MPSLHRGTRPLRLPNLLIAGVNRAGTTSLFSFLAAHPDICGSNVKETCFFLPTRYGEEQPSCGEYERYFRHCKNQKYVMESTPGYFYGGSKIAEAIRSELGQIRILLVFRDPVDRLFSFYRFMKSMFQLENSIGLMEYIQRCNCMPIAEKRRRVNNRFWGVEGGYYVDYLPEWLEVFGKNIKVLFFDDLKDNPVGTIREVCQWLAIDPSVFADEQRLGVENRTMNIRFNLLHRAAVALNKGGEKYFRSNPCLKRSLRTLYSWLNEEAEPERLSPVTRARLKVLYAESNARLSALLISHGYNRLPAWLASEEARAGGPR